MFRPETKRAFTLIELLVVISIIAILSGITLTAISGSRSKARDGKRISDVSQIQLALEQYFDRCNAYPTSLTSSNAADCTANPSLGIVLGSYISTIPNPPSGVSGQTVYDYFYNSGRTDYILHATLENSNAVVQDGLPGATYTSGSGGWTSGTGVSPITCDNSAGSKSYCVGPK